MVHSQKFPPERGRLLLYSRSCEIIREHIQFFWASSKGITHLYKPPLLGIIKFGKYRHHIRCVCSWRLKSCLMTWEIPCYPYNRILRINHGLSMVVIVSARLRLWQPSVSLIVEAQIPSENTSKSGCLRFSGFSWKPIFEIDAMVKTPVSQHPDKISGRGISSSVYSWYHREEIHQRFHAAPNRRYCEYA